MPTDPKSAKKGLTKFVALLGSLGLKAARKLLVKLPPGVNFINIPLAAFTHAIPKAQENTVKL